MVVVCHSVFSCLQVTHMNRPNLKCLRAVLRYDSEVVASAGVHGGWVEIKPITRSVSDTGYERTGLAQLLRHEPHEQRSAGWGGQSATTQNAIVGAT